MAKKIYIPLYDIISCLSSTVDMICPEVCHHHVRVAYVALCLAEELDLDDDDIKEIVCAANLHDIGILNLKDRIKMLQYESDDIDGHTKRGYFLLKKIDFFKDFAEMIRYHHTSWPNLQKKEDLSDKIKLHTNLIFLADRVDTLIDKEKDILPQSKTICETLLKNEGDKFNPNLIRTLIKLAAKEAFWLELENSNLQNILRRKMHEIKIKLDIDDLLGFAMLLSQIIDFRSRFTSTHSAGVATVAEKLGKILGLSDYECKMLKLAGYLHDIGKLTVPNEILEKPGKLTTDEFLIVKRHTFYTMKALEKVEFFNEIKEWAAYHHEKLDGKGYPFRIQPGALSQMSRIMAIADIFTAITEKRPYRDGMYPHEALKIIDDMSKGKTLDSNIVNTLRENFSDINIAREEAQMVAKRNYEKMEKALASLN